MDPFPAAPSVPRGHVEALVAYADACAAWLHQDHQRAREHGHEPDGQSVANLIGYQFTADFLRESYDDPT